MEFGSSHVYFVRSGGPIATVSDDNGVRQESIALGYAYGRVMDVPRWPLTKCFNTAILPEKLCKH